MYQYLQLSRFSVGVGYASPANGARAEETVVVVCTERLEHPHWSSAGQTVVFKTRVTCFGNKATIRVRVTTLMGRVTKNGMVLVAGTREGRTVGVTGTPSKPFYTPGETAKKVRITGRYRGQATLEITEPGGVKTPPTYMQTPIVSVRAH